MFAVVPSPKSQEAEDPFGVEVLVNVISKGAHPIFLFEVKDGKGTSYTSSVISPP